MILFDHYNIKSKTSFSIDAHVKKLIIAESVKDIEILIHGKSIENCNLLVMGGGSNMLFCENFDGTVLIPAMKGIQIVSEQDNEVIVEAHAGEEWDSFVDYCVQNAFYGLENLSFIPGNVGACPIQNIGAYGVEVCQLIESVYAIEIATGHMHRFSNSDCEFEYRNSVFKRRLAGKFIVCSVRFRLSKSPILHIEYNDLAEYFKNKSNITIFDVRTAIIEIRRKKLPDPAITGNAGSFFKNPLIEESKLETLKQQFPTIVCYAQPDGAYKVAAGWLIDKAGWKGYRDGDAGVHPNQALCLINYGNASGNDILKLSKKIQESVFEQFGIELEAEVRIVKS